MDSKNQCWPFGSWGWMITKQIFVWWWSNPMRHSFSMNLPESKCPNPYGQCWRYNHIVVTRNLTKGRTPHPWTFGVKNNSSGSYRLHYEKPTKPYKIDWSGSVRRLQHQHQKSIHRMKESCEPITQFFIHRQGLLWQLEGNRDRFSMNSTLQQCFFPV